MILPVIQRPEPSHTHTHTHMYTHAHEQAHAHTHTLSLSFSLSHTQAHKYTNTVPVIQRPENHIWMKGRALTAKYAFPIFSVKWYRKCKNFRVGNLCWHFEIVPVEC
jgi:hypothetical protein